MSESGGGSLMTPAWVGVSNRDLAHAASREGKPLIDHVTGTREHDICPPFTSGGSDLPPLTHPHKQLLWVRVILTNFFDRETGNDDLCEWEGFWCMQNICGNSETALMSSDVHHESACLGIDTCIYTCIHFRKIQEQKKNNHLKYLVETTQFLFGQLS